METQSDSAEIEEIRKRWRGAGRWIHVEPWEVARVTETWGDNDDTRSIGMEPGEWKSATAIADTVSVDDPKDELADVIAAAPADIHTLLATVDALTAERDAAQARVKELEAALRMAARMVEALHPHMNPEEPCVVYDAWLAAQEALHTGRKEAHPNA